MIYFLKKTSSFRSNFIYASISPLLFKMFNVLYISSFKAGFLVSAWGPRKDGATNYMFIKVTSSHKIVNTIMYLLIKTTLEIIIPGKSFI